MQKIIWTLLCITNLALYLCLIGMWIIIPDYLILNLSTSIFTLVFTVFLMWKHRDLFTRYISSEHFENLVNYSVRAFLIFGILGLVNYLAYKHPKQWDVTSGQNNSLSQESIQVVQKLDAPIEFQVFADKMTKMTIAPLLELYRFYNSDIVIRYIDPALHPQLVKKYGVEQNGAVVVEYKNRKAQFAEHSEKAITKSLLQVQRERAPVIAFSSGHKELDPYSNDKDGISGLEKFLKNAAYQIKKIQIAAMKDLDSIDALVILGPKTPFLEQEIQLLEQYLKAGGRLFLGMDPDFNGKQVHPLAKLVEKWGIQIGHDIVVDTVSNVNGSDGLVPIVNQFNKKHPITKNFLGTTFFPLTSSVSYHHHSRQGVKIQPLLETSSFPASWAEKDLSQVVSGKVIYSDTDGKGPISLGVAMEEDLDQEKKSKMVVLGNSTFVSNSYAQHGNNFHFFLNSLAWLIDQDFKISFDRSGLNNSPVFLNQTQVMTIFYFSVMLLPLMLLGGAIYMHLRRR